MVDLSAGKSGGADLAKTWTAKSVADLASLNPHKAGSPDHDSYSNGFNYAVHKRPKLPGDRKAKAWQTGLVQGMMWRRRNPTPGV